MSQLKLRFDFFLVDYQTTARNFKGGRIMQVFALLREYDLKSKGVGSNLAGRHESELLKELVWRMMHM
jgi:DNA polymerase-3 subunit delta